VRREIWGVLLIIVVILIVVLKRWLILIHASLHFFHLFNEIHILHFVAHCYGWMMHFEYAFLSFESLMEIFISSISDALFLQDYIPKSTAEVLFFFTSLYCTSFSGSFHLFLIAGLAQAKNPHWCQSRNLWATMMKSLTIF